MSSDASSVSVMQIKDLLKQDRMWPEVAERLGISQYDAIMAVARKGRQVDDPDLHKINPELPKISLVAQQFIEGKSYSQIADALKNAGFRGSTKHVVSGVIQRNIYAHLTEAGLERTKLNAAALRPPKQAAEPRNVRRAESRSLRTGHIPLDALTLGDSFADRWKNSGIKEKSR